MNEQEQFWAGEFGNEYTQRNRVDWRARIPFWRNMIDLTRARSVYEYGCNAGWNLTAIRAVAPHVAVRGYDINQLAVQQARAAGLDGDYTIPVMFRDTYELVFTAGVLIHVPQAELKALMESLIRASAQYVLAVEYEADEETEIMYRGHNGRLWKRPFGQLYEDLGLRLMNKLDAGPGFDRCTAWLMEK